MVRLSARTVVILAAFCFTGMVIIQVVWMQSAYQGEVALYTKAKKQFEAELQTELARNEQLKKGLSDFLADHRQDQRISEAQMEWFHVSLVQAIDFSPKKSQFGVYTEGISIVQHQHNRAGQRGIITLATNIYETPGQAQVEKAGKLCVHCILGLKEAHDQSSYQLLLFYKDRELAIFEELGLLIVGALLLLIILGLLFRAILRRYQQEKKLSEAKNDFINNLSHEMQTPVFAIQMANRLIKEKTTGLPDIAPLTSIVEKETGQLKQHATKILELASLESDQVEIQKQATEMNTFIREKTPTLEFMLQNKEGKLITHFHSKPVYVQIDRVHFNNLLTSLVDNAIKYSVKSPEVILETEDLGNQISIRVKDNGIGIEQQYLPYVFDKFYRVPGVKRHGAASFGLGLSYVKQVVQLHKGTIEIKSEKEKGTTVSIFLPKSPPNA